MEKTAVTVCQLRDMIRFLPARDADFANSLVNQWSRKMQLSDKQWPYVFSLISKAKGIANPAPKPEPVATEAVKEPTLKPLQELFDRFREEGTVKARILFGNDDNRYNVSLAPASGRNPGYLYVKRDSEYVGKVTPDGPVSRSDGMSAGA